MSGPVRVTDQLLDVLEAFLEALDEGKELHGWAIVKATGRRGPTVYGVLDRLEDADWIVGRWEEQPAKASTPRRRFYRLTPNGVVSARDLLAARRPAAVGRWMQQPRLGPAFIGWIRGLTGGAL